MEDFKLCPLCGRLTEPVGQDYFNPSTDSHDETVIGYACKCGYESINDDYLEMHEEAKWL